jgi:hypothetical protein
LACSKASFCFSLHQAFSNYSVLTKFYYRIDIKPCPFSLHSKWVKKVDNSIIKMRPGEYGQALVNNAWTACSLGKEL